jgi:hypothetical protein
MYQYAMASPLTKTDRSGKLILDWLFPDPSNDNIPPGICVFVGEEVRSEGQWNTPGQCTIVQQEYCLYACHSGNRKSYAKIMMHVPCAAAFADTPPYDN